MIAKLSESEYHVLEILWNRGDTTAKKIAEILNDEVGWSKTTTYTVLKRSINKGIIQRTDPNFVCHALISKQEAQSKETNELIDHLYDGSPKKLISFLVDDNRLSEKDIADLKDIIRELE